jgi:hypothetical protein
MEAVSMILHKSGTFPRSGNQPGNVNDFYLRKKVQELVRTRHLFTIVPEAAPMKSRMEIASLPVKSWLFA